MGLALFGFEDMHKEDILPAGDKSEAKAMMTEADVPVVPGYHGSDQATDRSIPNGVFGTVRAGQLYLNKKGFSD